jgi:hypothetical protein
MEDDPQKNEMEDDLNFKAVLLSYLITKTSKTNGFDTIEIDLVRTVFDFDHHWGFRKGYQRDCTNSIIDDIFHPLFYKAQLAPASAPAGLSLALISIVN